MKKKDPNSHRIIEKRRRDRMNNCLADLNKLIPSHYMKKGRGRVEKTEIIEMAIRTLKDLNKAIDYHHQQQQQRLQQQQHQPSAHYQEAQFQHQEGAKFVPGSSSGLTALDLKSNNNNNNININNSNSNNYHQHEPTESGDGSVSDSSGSNNSSDDNTSITRQATGTGSVGCSAAGGVLGAGGGGGSSRNNRNGGGDSDSSMTSNTSGVSSRSSINSDSSSIKMVHYCTCQQSQTRAYLDSQSGSAMANTDYSQSGSKATSNSSSQCAQNRAWYKKAWLKRSFSRPNFM